MFTQDIMVDDFSYRYSVQKSTFDEVYFSVAVYDENNYMVGHADNGNLDNNYNFYFIGEECHREYCESIVKSIMEMENL